METMMPPKAVQQRSEQLALLSRIHHKLGTDPEIGKLLGSIQTSPNYPSYGASGETQHLPHKQKLQRTNRVAREAGWRLGDAGSHNR